jgi:hypothetical protein
MTKPLPNQDLKDFKGNQSKTKSIKKGFRPNGET